VAFALLCFAHIGDDTAAGAARGADIIANHFDGARPGGLFAVRQTDAAAAAALLADVDRRLTPAQAAACDGPITEAELRAALRSMPRGSAPGSDGLPFEFYTTFWGDNMAEALLAVMNEPFLSAAAAPRYCHSMRLGVLTLLHKGKGTPLTHINSYRPITLLNSDYKIAAKVIALRLAAALETVVDVTQTAFVPGRWIGDNILLHQAILDHLNPDQSINHQSPTHHRRQPARPVAATRPGLRRADPDRWKELALSFPTSPGSFALHLQWHVCSTQG
jgi:hypothetical protein